MVMLAKSQMFGQENGYLPIVREGVKWINEKVIVNHGDTTSYYYTYEFSGTDTDTETNLSGDVNHACYYYIGETLDVDNDSLIAGLRENGSEGYDYHTVTCLRNEALSECMSRENLMLYFDMMTDGGTTLLYAFGDYGCDDYYQEIDDFQVNWLGKEPFITHDNFIKVEPLSIEDIECERYAYIGEEGDTLAYVVEGIGFDSYDMGDLLVPFTRNPDPTANYQEWCGLSHVVKDGQLIYKGMRYREGVHVGVDEVVVEQPRRVVDNNYYNLMGQPVGKEVPTTPGIYIHQGKKIVVR